MLCRAPIGPCHRFATALAGYRRVSGASRYSRDDLLRGSYLATLNDSEGNDSIQAGDGQFRASDRHVLTNRRLRVTPPPAESSTTHPRAICTTTLTATVRAQRNSWQRCKAHQPSTLTTSG